MTTKKVSLKMTATVNGDTLRVSYVLANSSSRTLVVFDGATGVGEAEYPDLTGQCYVSHAGAAVARVLRIRPPAHPFKDTTRTFMPAVSEVAPGEMRKVRFRLALPLRERSEFSPHFAGAKYAKQSIDTLELRIGGFWKTPETILKPLGQPNVWRVVKGASLTETFQVSARAKVTFELQGRTDASFIRM
jgi:hypothetical protein